MNGGTPASSQIVLGRAFNRSLLGTLNDFTSMARAYTEAPDEGILAPHDLALWLANTPIRPLQHKFPEIATQELFGVPQERPGARVDDSIL